MKKLLLVFTVCAFFVACNDSTKTNTEVNSDTSTVVTPSTMDTTNMMNHDSTTIIKTDSTTTPVQ